MSDKPEKGAEKGAGKGRKRRKTATTAHGYSTASRLNSVGLRSSIREAFSSFWRIDGKPGLWGFVRGCKADYKPKANEVIAQPDFGPEKKVSGAVLAVFQRDSKVEELVLDAVGK